MAKLAAHACCVCQNTAGQEVISCLKLRRLCFQGDHEIFPQHAIVHYLRVSMYTALQIKLSSRISTTHLGSLKMRMFLKTAGKAINTNSELVTAV